MPEANRRRPRTARNKSSARNRPRRAAARRDGGWVRKTFFWTAGILVALGLCAFIAGLIGLAIAYPNLPDISELSSYSPKEPLRIYTADHKLMGEFGEERRRMTPIAEIPDVLKNAVLAVEDARFYEHGGIDYVGVARAVLANLADRRSQGASTITMQVARNVYLTSEKTYTRKLYEMLLTLKMERLLSKDQILEIYMNQIYLGHHSYGFAAAARTYFGKSLDELNAAEAAMLAGIPKSPSSGNPITNFQRARTRQLHVIDRMVESGFLTKEEGEKAKEEPLHLRRRSRLAGEESPDENLHGQYVAETARRFVYARFGDETYTRGFNVYTTIDSRKQTAAWQAVQQGVLAYERRQAYRGPEKFIRLPEDAEERQTVINETLDEFPDVGAMVAAVVTEVSAKRMVAINSYGETIEMTGNQLIGALSGLAERAAPAVKIRPGAVIRVMKNRDDEWESVQLPGVEAALVAMDPRNGAIEALIGDVDFASNKFNHVTQAWRQPGSSFKPFIYSAALEKQFSPSTIIDDSPLYFGPEVTGGRPWQPKNYEGGFQGPMPMQQGLAKSRNIISIRILEKITPRYARDWITRFGFDASKHPPYLTMALGAGSVTPMQMATAFSVFADQGRRHAPTLITRITNERDETIFELDLEQQARDGKQAIPARNAFVMNTMLNEVTRRGTAARAQATLGRKDLYGKTGTTNNSVDAWFVGFQPTQTAAVWMGYDNPRNLGSRETGGGLSLPIWIDYMREALDGVPVATLEPPSGVVREGDYWVYSENAHGGGITNLDGAGREPDLLDQDMFGPLSPTEERSRILDMFRD